MSKRKKKKERRSVAGATQKRRERAEKDYSDMFNLPEGMKMFNIDGKGIVDIDVIPYTVGEGNPAADEGDFYWERTFYIHRNIGVNEDWVICPARTSKKKCPICEYISTLQNDPDADEDTIKALQPSKRMLLNVLHKKRKDKSMRTLAKLLMMHWLRLTRMKMTTWTTSVIQRVAVSCDVLQNPVGKREAFQLNG